MTHDTRNESRKETAQRLFEAFRAAMPVRRRRGLAMTDRPGEFQLLHRLSMEPAGSAVRMGDLADWLGVRPPTVSQLVDSLVARELVERELDTVDRRVTRVRLSTRGQAHADAFHERALQEFEALTEHLGEQDAARLAELLDKTAIFMAGRFADTCTGTSHHHRSRPTERGESTR